MVLSRRPSGVGVKRSIALACALIALLAMAAAADGANRRPKPPPPVVTAVTPAKPELGERLIIKGRRFSTRRPANTVILRSPAGATAFLKPLSASRRRLAVRLPLSLDRLMVRRAGALVPTRFRVRVLTRRRFSAYLPTSRSPVVMPPESGGPGGGGDVGGDCDRDGIPDGTDANDDTDLLADALEAEVGTDPCKADTDGDGLEDGWEYWAARDLNQDAVPYPGRRPFSNPLDPSDAGVDFDGDSLTMAEEHALWRYVGSGFDPGRAAPESNSPLAYSDGTQTSRPGETPAVPAFRSASFGIPFAPPSYPARLELRDDGVWSDDERDADRDGVTNYHETHGPGTQGWWKATLGLESVPAWPKSPYGTFAVRPFADLDPLNPDVDGDRLLDGEDDQDNDDVANLFEMYERTYDVGGTPFQVNPFNPCAPDAGSRTCPAFAPF